MSAINAKVKLVDGMQFVGEGQSGHAILMDGMPEFGGNDTALRPMELLLIGLGGCTGMDTVSILRKKKQRVTGLELNIKGLKAEKDPMRFTEIEMEYVIKGKGINEEAVKRAIELSMTRYCSVKATLEEKTNIGIKYRIEEEEAGA